MLLRDIAKEIDPADGTSKALSIYEQYEAYLAPLADKPVRMLEIGVHLGSSLATFGRYLRAGVVVGVDIKKPERDFVRPPNTIFEIGDQRDSTRLNEITDKYAPDGWDIIIDDASHYGSWSALTFDALFPRLKPSGLYVVEDWQTGYWDDWPDGARYQELPVPVPQDHIPRRVPSHDAGMVGFIKRLVDHVARRPATTRFSHVMHPGTLEWIHVNYSFASMKKRCG